MLKTIAVSELEEEIELSKFEKAFAIDGSIARLETGSIELAAIKIGCVTEDIEKLREYRSTLGHIDPEWEDQVYSIDHLEGVFPGSGLYKKGSSDSWEQAFLLEVFENLKNMRLPGSRTGASVLDVLLWITPNNKEVRCFDCEKKENTKGRVRFKTEKVLSCPQCMQDVYLSNYLFTKSLLATKEDPFQKLMLIIERLTMTGVVLEAARGESNFSIEDTLFILDGPLAIFFGSAAVLNTYFLNELQRIKNPVLFGIEKTGNYKNFSSSDDVQEILQPGQVALITTEMANRIRGEQVGFTKPYHYGKHFFYKTLDGENTYVFLALPKSGNPYKFDKNDIVIEEWENYPHLKSICKYLESSKIDLFNEESAIDIIAEANYAASLPRKIALDYLLDVVEEL